MHDILLNIVEIIFLEASLVVSVGQFQSFQFPAILVFFGCFLLNEQTLDPYCIRVCVYAIVMYLRTVHVHVAFFLKI